MTTSETPCWYNENLPPPVASEYSPKGTWEQTGDLKSYIVGPKTSKKALLFVYDAFGATSQVIQGADRLSEHMNALVVMPDFFEGNVMDMNTFMNNKPVFEEFRKKYLDLEKNLQMILEFMATLTSHFPSVESWGCFGLCWGGKVAVLASNAEKNHFRASGQGHPGRMSADDANALTIPHIVLPSKDEPADAIADYERILTEKKLGKVVNFPTMFHGWMGGRADFADKEVSAEYQRGYAITAQFFVEHL